MEEVMTARERNMRDKVFDFDNLQYQLECTACAISAMQIAAEQMGAEGISEKELGKALYVVQAFLTDLSHEQQEWYEDIKKAAGIH